jgi:multiple antibiotic resistance protein
VEAVLTASLTLFLVMDPLGNIPVFLSVLSSVDAGRRRKVLARELVISLAVLIAFLFTGQRLLSLFGIEPSSIRIAGGIVLFLIALRMVFPQEGGVMGEIGEEPFVVPLAIPLIAGPSTLATLLLLSQAPEAKTGETLAALFCAWVASAAILLSSTALVKVLRPKGLTALERLMGMLLVMMSVQMFLDGLRQGWGPATP